jgi:hypothetical protein
MGINGFVFKSQTYSVAFAQDSFDNLLQIGESASEKTFQTECVGVATRMLREPTRLRFALSRQPGERLRFTSGFRMD